ncbi:MULTISPECIES: methyl-accepting chemotaxis protein [Cupriavidus]|jgi:methyl-accepting chemotaxis protein|uniref:methyl-accepting chemotaxis protein n=1 Tax=Cupriavidus TaxID=106589 RepID=UPI001D0CC27A|nr:methyl-accepting chemotaxis protein [Cupriavidus pauculus]MCM3609399.1 methyl-accepting chemotaxis protein [Cupriavidus pauculus]
MNFQQLTVKTKLAASFGLLAIMVLVVSGLSLKSLNDANGRFANYVAGVNARANMAAKVRTAVDRRAIAARNLLLVTKASDIELEKAEVMRAHVDVQARLKQLNDMMAAAADAALLARDMVAQINRTEQVYGPVALGIVEAALNNRRDEAISMLNDRCRPILRDLVKATNDYAQYTEGLAAQIVQNAEERSSSQRNLLIAICISSLLAAVAAGIVITRDLIRTLGAEPAALNEVTQRIAGGDLSPIPGVRQAPRGSVMAAMGEMQARLVQLIGEVHSSANNIAAGSNQIAAGNVDLSSRTERQASSLQETALSMEALTSTVQQNADNAQQASGLATNASEVSQRGGTVVGQVVNTMGEISQSSTKIADIIGMIEGIAFQTNILALNAAVEAARAGEQGRGFAVVAGEVRSLAQRSSSAAKEIKDLITASVEKIQQGSVLAADAGKTISEVTHAVARVTDIMGEIAAASQEQSRGISQINEAITELDEVTQQNAALVEQAAAAAQSLQEQTTRMMADVSFFKLGGETRSSYRGGPQPTLKSPSV